MLGKGFPGIHNDQRHFVRLAACVSDAMGFRFLLITKLLIHSQTLTASSLKFGNGQVIQAIHYMVLITQLDIVLSRFQYPHVL